MTLSNIIAVACYHFNFIPLVNLIQINLYFPVSNDIEINESMD